MAMKMKRKGADQFSDDFTEFSLSFSARKIRCLDAELPPIVEEEDSNIPNPLIYEQQPVAMAEEKQVRSDLPVIEELPSASDNQENAIVLFKPVNTPYLVSPSNFSVTVDSDIISGIKNQFARSRHSERLRSAEEEARCRDKTNDQLAVVPWVPSQFPPASSVYVANMEAPELMEAEEMGEASMDIEEDNSNSNIDTGHPTLYGGITDAGGGLHQWQQQHCMIPQVPLNTSTPITWTR
ncbi:hypothetical protein L6164_006942 [Bauhinia variegata]|uniref:Uncharacterized protein n=1 Tax=Bauhinia variegata TaxID=167791 RepID=A0ACB9PVD9_BAUVA|nr:hypothetical protein L6164_006942 [Bauhinia variegata]